MEFANRYRMQLDLGSIIPVIEQWNEEIRGSRSLWPKQASRYSIDQSSESVQQALFGARLLGYIISVISVVPGISFAASGLGPEDRPMQVSVLRSTQQSFMAVKIQYIYIRQLLRHQMLEGPKKIWHKSHGQPNYTRLDEVGICSCEQSITIRSVQRSILRYGEYF